MKETTVMLSMKTGINREYVCSLMVQRVNTNRKFNTTDHRITTSITSENSAEYIKVLTSTRGKIKSAHCCAQQIFLRVFTAHFLFLWTLNYSYISGVS